MNDEEIEAWADKACGCGCAYASGDRDCVSYALGRGYREAAKDGYQALEQAVNRISALEEKCALLAASEKRAYRERDEARVKALEEACEIFNAGILRGLEMALADLSAAVDGGQARDIVRTLIAKHRGEL